MNEAATGDIAFETFLHRNPSILVVDVYIYIYFYMLRFVGNNIFQQL